MPGSPKRHRLKPGPIAQHRKIASTPNAQRISADKLRRLVNDAGVLQKAADNEYSEEIIYSEHPSSPLASEPVCTKSQIVAYLAPDGNEVAQAHRYLREDGQIGLGGLPDPKKMYLNGILYYTDLTG